MAEPRGALHALVAEFDEVGAVIAAARAVREAGYVHFDVYSPFPIHGIDRAMGLRATRLPWLVLGCGLTGTTLALFFQWWTNAHDYAFKISAKPLFGIPANIPITFEFTVLLAAFGAFFGMLLLNRLPEHHHALFELERFRRATDDGFFLAIEARDPRFDAAHTRALLQSLTQQPVVACHEAGESRALPGWVRASFAGAGALALLPFAAICAARYRDSAGAPFHLIKDMDSQPRYRAQAANAFFADGRAQRPDVPGTVAFDRFQTDLTLLTGRKGAAFAAEIPLPVTAELMQRGQRRFAVYCTPCHGGAGYGDGLVAQRAQTLQEPTWVPPASLHDALVRGRPVGQIFDTIRNGVRTMPAYGRQMSLEDSWAIVAYVRALQRSQNATLADVPPEERARLGTR
jgi:mono/diheme cytochrome c family protein